MSYIFNNILPIGNLFDRDLIRYIMRFTELGPKTMMLFPPLGPIYLKAVAVQAMMFNLEVIPLGSGYASTIAVCRKSYIKNRKHRKLAFLNKISADELKYYEDCLIETLAAINKKCINYYENEIDILCPTIPTYIGIDRNIFFDNYDDHKLYVNQVLFSSVDNGNYPMDCTEDVEISELYDIYNSSNHEVDNFVTGEFSNPYSSMYENFREKLEDEAANTFKDFEIIGPSHDYIDYLSYTCQILGHVLELTGIDRTWTKKDIGNLFRNVQKRKLSIFRCNPTHYLVSFRTAAGAEQALEFVYPNIKIGKLLEGTPLGALIASRYDLFAVFRNLKA